MQNCIVRSFTDKDDQNREDEMGRNAVCTQRVINAYKPLI
jgi:hypothetical protein